MTRPALILALVTAASAAGAQVAAIRAGRLIDPETGVTSTNQIILVDSGRFRTIGADVRIPAGAA